RNVGSGSADDERFKAGMLRSRRTSGIGGGGEALYLRETGPENQPRGVATTPIPHRLPERPRPCRGWGAATARVTGRETCMNGTMHSFPPHAPSRHAPVHRPRVRPRTLLRLRAGTLLRPGGD